MLWTLNKHSFNQVPEYLTATFASLRMGSFALPLLDVPGWQGATTHGNAGGAGGMQSHCIIHD